MPKLGPGSASGIVEIVDRKRKLAEMETRLAEAESQNIDLQQVVAKLLLLTRDTWNRYAATNLEGERVTGCNPHLERIAGALFRAGIIDETGREVEYVLPEGVDDVTGGGE